MERQVTLKSIIIPSSLGLIAPLVICRLITHESFADSPSFPFKRYIIPYNWFFMNTQKDILYKDVNFSEYGTVDNDISPKIGYWIGSFRYLCG
jgi:hypothetical protein